MKKTIISLLVFAVTSAFAAPAVYQVKRLAGWTPVIDGSLSEWPAAAQIDSIHSDTNVYARTSTYPWTRGEIQFLVYAAHDANKVFFAVKVIADNSVVTGNHSNGDNVKVNPGGQAMSFYVCTDGTTYQNPSCPYTLNSTLFTARSMTWNPGMPSYEFSISRQTLDPFGMNQFQISIGSEDHDADSSLCYLALGAYYTGGKQAWGSNPWDNPLYYPTYNLLNDTLPPIPTNLSTHVFWNNGVKTRYNIAERGPGFLGGLIVHDGMLASGAVAQNTGTQSDGFNIGSGLNDVEGRCSFVWSKELNEMTGTVAYAKVRGEYRDGWSGSALNNAGPIAIRCGVADYAGNITAFGNAESVPCNATWQDFLNPLGSTMGYDLGTTTLQAEEIINFTALAGRPSSSAPSVLDGRFFELDVTDQVNWILAHAGQHAIVFLVAPGQGSIGKVNLYANECGGSAPGMGSDMPWTLDGNTLHLVARGDMAYASGSKMLLARDTGSNSTAYLHLNDTASGSMTLTHGTVAETLAGYVKLRNLNLTWNSSVDPKVDSARIVVTYTDSMLAVLNDAPDTSLRIGYYNGTTWNLLETSLGANRRASATITSKGYYALFVSYNPTEAAMHRINGVACRIGPNPFNHSTAIEYRVSGQSPVKIQVFNIRGLLVKTLVDGVSNPGVFSTAWNGTDKAGNPLPSGVYLVQLRSGRNLVHQKINLLR